LLGLARAKEFSFGLRLDSEVMTDNPVTVLDPEIDSVLGSLPEMEKVESALLYTF